ncbi:MAG: hypothetical protein AB1810_06535 [Pseudomonadota bacterium]
MKHATSSKGSHLTVLIEFIVSAGLGIYFHWVLHWEKEAYLVLAVGMLLTLATYLVLEEIGRTRSLILGRYEHAHSLLSALSKIDEPECQQRAHNLLASAERTLTLLQSGYIPLDESEFYLEAARAASQSRQQIQAVDTFPHGWDSKGAMCNYYLANVQAVARGVKVIRVFVLTRLELNNPAVQRVLQGQLGDGIDVRVAFSEELRTGSGENVPWRDASQDFALYDGRTVAERIGPAVTHFGRKTQCASEIQRYRRWFEIIEHHAYPVELRDGRVGLADGSREGGEDDCLIQKEASA